MLWAETWCLRVLSYDAGRSPKCINRRRNLWLTALKQYSKMCGLAPRRSIPIGGGLKILSYVHRSHSSLTEVRARRIEGRRDREFCMRIQFAFVIRFWTLSAWSVEGGYLQLMCYCSGDGDEVYSPLFGLRRHFIQGRFPFVRPLCDFF